MESSTVCLLLEAIFVAVCMLPSLTTTKPTDDKMAVPDNDLQIGHNSKRAINSNCVSDSCEGRPNGNYPTCYLECQLGFYVACSNGDIFKIQCPLGWYTAVDGTRYTAPMLYVPETDSCQLEANYCHIESESQSTSGNRFCIKGSCERKSNGNYPSCNTDCKQGFYVACSSEVIFRQLCPLGWYNFPNGSRYTSPMIYIPETDSCELEPNYCRKGFNPVSIYEHGGLDW